MEKPKTVRRPVLYPLCCLAAAIEGRLLLINLMKRNILTSDPAVRPSWYTFVLDLIGICVSLFLAVQAAFISMRKKPPLYRSFDWQTASKKPWSNVPHVLLDTGCVVSLISLNGIVLFIVMAILITCQFMLHYVKYRENKHNSAEIIP